MATREVPLEKETDTKYLQVSVLTNVASMTKRGDDMLTHKIGRQCPDALGMRRRSSGGEIVLDKVKGFFDLRVVSKTYQ